ncbi:MAG: glycosyltransferase [Tepidibacillus sp.]
MKVLIVTEVIAGRGHYKAAESILKSIKDQYPTHEVKIVNILSIVSKRIERIVQAIYLSMITKRPQLWGWIYKKETRLSFLFKELLADLIRWKLEKFILDEVPQVVIATHASGLGALSKIKEKHHFLLGAVFTDYHLNSFWIHSNIDYYCVGHESLKEKLITNYQIDPEKIYVTGIPIDPIFAKSHQRQQVNKRNSEKGEKDSFRILVMGGGLGFGGIKEIIGALNQIKEIPISVTIITGTNQHLFDDITKMKSTLNYQIQLLQYTEEVYLIMKNNDVLITKPGGMTVSEALTVPIPILIYKPIPGQEEHNANFLVKNHSAIRINHIEYIPYWIKYLYHHPNLLTKLKNHQAHIAKPSSALFISSLFLKNEVRDENMQKMIQK